MSVRRVNTFRLMSVLFFGEAAARLRGASRYYVYSPVICAVAALSLGLSSRTFSQLSMLSNLWSAIISSRNR